MNLPDLRVAATSTSPLPFASCGETHKEDIHRLGIYLLGNVYCRSADISAPQHVHHEMWTSPALKNACGRSLSLPDQRAATTKTPPPSIRIVWSDTGGYRSEIYLLGKIYIRRSGHLSAPKYLDDMRVGGSIYLICSTCAPFTRAVGELAWPSDDKHPPPSSWCG